MIVYENNLYVGFNNGMIHVVDKVTRKMKKKVLLIDEGLGNSFLKIQ
jgi:hypothetical protein